ncbi:MAG TPA: glycerophosphodiester phosphodiesterase [Candidatus Limnocylindrales bacterium]
MATLRLAHRGDWREAPENSLAAMQAAILIPGCDGLEFDIRASADGVPVLLHDATLARVQGIPSACVTLTAAELARHGIPALGEVLQAVGCDPFLDVELKERVQRAIDVLELERGRIDDDGKPVLRSAVVSSFDPAILRWLAEQRPTWPRWLNAHDLSRQTIELAVELGCAAVAAEWHSVDAVGVAMATDAGIAVASWTVRDPVVYARFVELGLIAVCGESDALGR